MANRTTRVAFSALLLLISVYAAGCSSSDGGGKTENAGEEGTGARSVRVETLVLQPEPFRDMVQLTGTVEATNDANLSAQSAGTVTRLVERGAFVRAGGVVAQLDAGIARASMEQAEASVAAAKANLDLAKDNIERQEPLYRDSIISAIEFEQARAQFNQASAQVAQARAVLSQAREGVSNTTVLAPFAGVVEERFVERGEQVMPGAPVARIVNTGQVKVVAGVPERYAGDIEVGTNVEIGLQGAGNRLGRVSFVGSAVDPESRTFPVEITLANQDGTLKPQMVASVLITRQQLDGVIVVPRSAVIRHESGNSVYVVRGGAASGTAEIREVTLGSAYGDRTVVTSGLQAGDEVVVLGQNNLTEGDPVEVVDRYSSVDATLAADL